MRTKLAWKLSAVVVAILATAIILSGYASNLTCAHYSMESARAFLRFNSESIINGIGRLMMNRNNQGIEQLIVDMSRDSTVYGDVRLVSHPSGEVVASRFGRQEGALEPLDPICAVCHSQDDPVSAGAEMIETIIDLPGGNRTLSIMAPIANEPGCRNAACHAHDADPPFLGFLNADYSLDRVDAMVTAGRTQIAAAVFASLLLGIIALRFLLTRLLENPIRELIGGTQRIAARRFDFRFDKSRNDEIGTLQESFNSMVASVQSHRNELRATLEYLRGIVENSADLIITVNPDGLIETFNRGAEKALGYSRAELIGRPVETLFVDPRDRAAALAQLKDADSVRNYETRFLAKDGQIREVLLTLSRLHDRDGNPIGTFGISKDITQEKKLQQELVRSQKLAAIGQAVTGIQHAIKNTLNPLTGGSYLVRTGIAKHDQEQAEEGRAMIDEGIERIRSLSRNMLCYAKDRSMQLQRVDLNKMIAKICELHRKVSGEHGLVLRQESPEGLPCVRCDPQLIQLAVTDILVNAIDACSGKQYVSGESPEVVLSNSLTEDGGFFVIEVRDNGCGMTNKVKQNIFTPFFSTKRGSGTGLGLALSARIIEQHRGEISVESEPDHGSVFQIRLPTDSPAVNKEVADVQASSHN